MIDLHCHILPGVDDGARDMAESVAMARLYVAAGYDMVVATPHYLPGTSWTPDAGRVRDGVAALNAALAEAGIGLQALTGMEIAMDSSIGELLAENKLLTLAGSCYLLVEVPFQQLPYGWDQVVFDLIGRGYTVLLAHPERCAQLLEKPAMFDKLVDAGCRLQVNWGSLVGLHGSREKGLARWLAERGYIHCLATDSHDMKYRNAGVVPSAMAVFTQIAGARAARAVVDVNPARVLRSEPLAVVERPPRVKKTGGLRRLFSWG